MKTKLTLSMDKELVNFARRRAQADGTSVSAMFTRFLMATKLQSESKATPSVKAMVGTLKGYAIDDSKPSVKSIYANKHLN
jgi:hypothetical protein